MPRARFSTGWGIRRDRKAQRGTGAGGGGGGGSNPQLPPLPASAVEYWHSELGASAANAIGQIGGRTLAAVGTPTVEPDPGFFNGKNVYKSSNIGPSYWAGSGFANLLVAGQRPWFFAIGRARSYPSGQVPALWLVGAVSGAGTQGFRHSGRGITPNGYYEAFRNNNGSSLLSADSTAGTGDTAAHTWELTGADATLGLVNIVDGAQVALNTGIVTQSAMVGAIDSATLCSSGAFTGNASVAFVLVCSSKPTDPEIAALRAWSASYWGV